MMTEEAFGRRNGSAVLVVAWSVSQGKDLGRNKIVEVIQS